MAEKESQESKIIRRIIGRRINMDQPVNQKITLPSAEKPAEPPKAKSRRSNPIHLRNKTTGKRPCRAESLTPDHR